MSAQNRRSRSTRSESESESDSKAAPRKSTPVVVVRGSHIHGKGVFATRRIAKGERIIEYKGEIITWAVADRRYADDGKNGFHTFLFDIDGRKVIDAAVGGNAARWINHSCEPNCEADEVEGRIFIKSLRNIKAGEELSYDYGLIIDEPYTKALKAEYPCWCGSKNCRGTLLAPKRRR